MSSSVFFGLRPWHGWELISETDSVTRAERALPMLRAVGKVPTRAACTLLLLHPSPLQCLQPQPPACPAHLTWLLTLHWPGEHPLCAQGAAGSAPVTPFSYSSVPWSGCPTPCFRSHLPPPQWKLLAPYLCNHLLATGRNSVLHCSFSQWGSPSSCGYGFANQCCLWLARVCAVLQLLLLSAKRACTWGLGGKSWF